MGHWLTINEVKLATNLSDKTIRRRIQSGALQAKREGNKLLIDMDSVRHLMATMDSDVSQTKVDIDWTKHIAVERSEWQGLLTRLGQLEAERVHLLEYHGQAEAKEKELRAALVETEKLRGALTEAEKQYYERAKAKENALREALAEAEKLRVAVVETNELRSELDTAKTQIGQRAARIRQLEQDLEAARRPWWQKIFGRK